MEFRNAVIEKVVTDIDSSLSGFFEFDGNGSIVGVGYNVAVFVEVDEVVAVVDAVISDIVEEFL